MKTLDYPPTSIRCDSDETFHVLSDKFEENVQLRGSSTWNDLSTAHVNISVNITSRWFPRTGKQKHAVPTFLFGQLYYL